MYRYETAFCHKTSWWPGIGSWIASFRIPIISTTREGLFVKNIDWSLLYINPKETSWGLEGPVAYISYHCVSLKNRFLLKGYVFLKNIVFHNIMCEKKLDCNFTDSFVKKLPKRLKRAS